MLSPLFFLSLSASRHPCLLSPVHFRTHTALENAIDCLENFSLHGVRPRFHHTTWTHTDVTLYPTVLTPLAPAMTDQDNSYRPRSPDFSGFTGSLQLPPSPYGQTPYTLNSPLAHRASYDASPFFNPQAPQPQPQFQRAAQQYIPQPLDTNYSPHIMPPQTRSRAAAEQPPMDWHASPESPPAPENHSNNTRRTAPSQSSGGIEVRTKFPVARIKRIMQADEDVGKVAQVTPIAVCMCPIQPLFCLLPPPSC